MARSFKIGDIPTSTVLPNGFYNLRIAAFEETISQNKGILMYKMEFRVVAPEVAENRAYYENLIIGKRPYKAPDGSNAEWVAFCELDDPMAEEPLTQRYASGLRTLKQILVALDHDLAGADVIDMDELMGDFNIKNPKEQFVVGARIREFSDTKRDNRLRNDVTVWYSADNEKPRLISSKEDTQENKSNTRTRAKTRTRVKAELPSYDDDDE